MKNNKFLVVSRQDFPLSIEDGKAAKLSILWCQPFRRLSGNCSPPEVGNLLFNRFSKRPKRNFPVQFYVGGASLI
jgi:hypothetical protein